MGRAFLWLFLGMALLSVGAAWGASVDYLGVPPDGLSMNPKESVRTGDPIAADVTLKRIGDILPEEAKLVLTVDMVNPWVQVDIDGNVQTFVGRNDIEVSLPITGVKEVKISAKGNAPFVEKLMRLRVMDVKTYVRYRGTPGENQNEVTSFLEVSNVQIERTVEAITMTEERYTSLESNIKNLKNQGINTVEMESDLQIARNLIKIARGLQEAGKIDEAKQTAQEAMKVLGKVEAKSSGIGIMENPNKARLYLGAIVLVVIVVVALLFVKSKREELG